MKGLFCSGSNTCGMPNMGREKKRVGTPPLELEKRYSTDQTNRGTSYGRY